MDKILYDNKLIISIADDLKFNECITIKEINNCIKALETIGKNITQINIKLYLDDDKINKQLTEKEYIKLNKIIQDDNFNINIVNENYVMFDNFKIRVNKDCSYDYQNEHKSYFKNCIYKVSLIFK